MLVSSCGMESHWAAVTGESACKCWKGARWGHQPTEKTGEGSGRDNVGGGILSPCPSLLLLSSAPSPKATPCPSPLVCLPPPSIPRAPPASFIWAVSCLCSPFTSVLGPFSPSSWSSPQVQRRSGDPSLGQMHGFLNLLERVLKQRSWPYLCRCLLGCTSLLFLDWPGQ